MFHSMDPQNYVLFNFRLFLADSEVLFAVTHFVKQLTVSPLATSHFISVFVIFVY